MRLTNILDRLSERAMDLFWGPNVSFGDPMIVPIKSPVPSSPRVVPGVAPPVEPVESVPGGGHEAVDELEELRRRINRFNKNHPQFHDQFPWDAA